MEFAEHLLGNTAGEGKNERFGRGRSQGVMPDDSPGQLQVNTLVKTIISISPMLS